MPALRFVETFHADDGYIKALAQNVNDYWMKHGRPAKLVLSFHGLPRRTLERGDPYHCFCQVTARLLARELGLEPSQWTLAFQSRFGRAQWLTPYTAEVLKALGKEKTSRVDVVCPGFVTDCLETLEEIAIEGREIFRKAGGGDFHVIPCLNEHPHVDRGTRRHRIPQPRGLARATAGRRRARCSPKCARRRWARSSSGAIVAEAGAVIEPRDGRTRRLGARAAAQSSRGARDRALPRAARTHRHRGAGGVARACSTSCRSCSYQAAVSGFAGQFTWSGLGDAFLPLALWLDCVRSRLRRSADVRPWRWR